MKKTIIKIFVGASILLLSSNLITNDAEAAKKRITTNLHHHNYINIINRYTHISTNHYTKFNNIVINNSVNSNKDVVVDKLNIGSNVVTGTGPTGVKVKVEILDKNISVETTIGKDGKWVVKLPSKLDYSQKIKITQTGNGNKVPVFTPLSSTDNSNSVSNKDVVVDKLNIGSNVVTGTGPAGVKVKVEILDKNISAETTIGKDGKWVVKLPSKLDYSQKIKITQTGNGNKLPIFK